MKNKIVFVSHLILFLGYSSLVLAQRAPNAGESVPHFTAGQYKLTTGDDQKCGDGPFEVITVDKGKYLQLGGRNGFFIENKKQKLPSDSPEEKGCVYEIDRQMTFKTSSTELSYSSVKKCKGKVVRTATETFFIESGKVTMNSVATGEEALSFNCFWEKK